MLSANQIGRIFNSTVSLEKIDEKVWFFACWYRFMDIKSWWSKIGVATLILELKNWLYLKKESIE